VSAAQELLRQYLAQRLAVEPGAVVLPAGQAVRPSARSRREMPPIPEDGITVETPQTTDLFVRDSLADLDLEGLEAMVRSCTKCPLHKSRTNAVFGEGPPDADLIVVGEGPGQTEDQTGRPFVGRAGQLLDEILAAIERPRPTVYIANIVKSRPPGNRKPTPDEVQACAPYLYRQIALIRPKVILAMGATAAETLLGTRGALTTFRNKVHRFRGVPLIVTYHPAALLRNPHWKRPTWDDVRIARQLLER